MEREARRLGQTLLSRSSAARPSAKKVRRPKSHRRNRRSDANKDIIAQRNRQIGANLKKVREELGIKPAHMSRMLGISQPQLGNYESGKSPMKAEMLFRIAAVLGVAYEDFFEGIAPPLTPRRVASKLQRQTA